MKTIEELGRIVKWYGDREIIFVEDVESLNAALTELDELRKKNLGFKARNARIEYLTTELADLRANLDKAVEVVQYISDMSQSEHECGEAKLVADNFLSTMPKEKGK